MAHVTSTPREQRFIWTTPRPQSHKAAKSPLYQTPAPSEMLHSAARRLYERQARLQPRSDEIPNVLDLLPRPRASLPPVDFNVLTRPLPESPGSSFGRRPATARGATPPSPSSSFPARPGAAHSISLASPRSQVTRRPGTVRCDDKRRERDDLHLMQPHSARVHLRNRRRAAALGEGAHTLAVHELMQRSPAGLPGGGVTSVLSMRRFGAVAAADQPSIQSPPRLANVVSATDGSRPASGRSSRRGSIQTRVNSRASSARSIRDAELNAEHSGVEPARPTVALDCGP
jgi:hypothetical protein